MKEESFKFHKQLEPNFTWKTGYDFQFNFHVEKTWYNRIKWYIGIRFLPGTYEWLSTKQ